MNCKNNCYFNQNNQCVQHFWFPDGKPYIMHPLTVKPSFTCGGFSLSNTGITPPPIVPKTIEERLTILENKAGV